MTEDFQESVGERLRRLRVERGLTQRALESPGVSYAYISRIEAGSRQPSVKALRRLARKLGVSPDYLETGSDLGAREEREIKLTDAELELRLAPDTRAAETKLRALAVEAEEAGDPVVTGRARAALGLAAFRRGDHAATIAELAPVVRSGSVTPIANPDVYATLSRAYVSSGAAQDAVALLRGCTADVEQAGSAHDAAYVRYATYLSYALSELGDLRQAREVVRSALDRAEELADPYTRVRLYWSQARLAMFERDSRSALDQLRRAVALLEATEDTRQLGRAHLLWAEILTFESEAEQARPHLDLAEKLLGPHPDAEDSYWLRTEQARHAAQLGHADEAIRLSREALELIGDSDPAEQGTAYWALGEGLAANGRAHEAMGALRHAVELLRSQNLWHEAAAASRTLATTLTHAGHTNEADQASKQATRLDQHASASRDAHIA